MFFALSQAPFSHFFFVCNSVGHIRLYGGVESGFWRQRKSDGMAREEKTRYEFDDSKRESHKDVSALSQTGRLKERIYPQPHGKERRRVVKLSKGTF